MKFKLFIVLFFSFFISLSQEKCDYISAGKSLESLINNGSTWRIISGYDDVIGDILTFHANNKLTSISTTNNFSWEKINNKIVISVNDYMFYEFVDKTLDYSSSKLKIKGTYDNTGKVLSYKKGNDIKGYGTSGGEIEMVLEKSIPVNSLNSINNSIQIELSQWEIQGEFEKTVDFKIRTAEINRNKYIKFIEQGVLNCYSLNIDNSFFKLERYNPDNETFDIITNETENIVINIPISEAESFKNSFYLAKFKNKNLKIINKKLVFSSLDIEIGNKTFKYINPIFEDTINNNSTIKKKRIPKSNF